MLCLVFFQHLKIAIEIDGLSFDQNDSFMDQFVNRTQILQQYH